LKKDIMLFLPLMLVFCSCFCLMFSVLEPATFYFLVAGAPMVRARISSFEDVCSSHLFFGLLGSGSPLAIAFCFKASTSSPSDFISFEFQLLLTYSPIISAACTLILATEDYIMQVSVYDTNSKPSEACYQAARIIRHGWILLTASCA